jgi:S-adenosylmethionine decarboxylase
MIYNGKHLMIDGLVSSERIHTLHDSTHGIDFLERIVHGIDMTMILPPLTVKFPHAISEMNRVLESLEKEGLANSETANQIRWNLKNRVEQTYGYSTLVMIAESHLSLHTFPEDGFATFDAYSCKDFDHEMILRLWDEVFGAGEKSVNIVDRRIPGK